MQGKEIAIASANPVDLPSTGGTYALGLHLETERQITVGALGAWLFPEGLYLYVGSAWGPGGLRARVGRHLAGSQTLRWHIDYLRQQAHPVCLWLAEDTRLECAWASWFAQQASAKIIVPRFGASDCTCTSHLVHLGEHHQVDFPFPHDILSVSGSLAQSGRAGAF